ncbi:hypothetical protein [Desulfurispira natronophila]|uniref:Uncharacterized protein n=1 Tax=Desulfurispira natronophila TaxID=682562 RepID=A0A7W7Y5U7_9BACT|nr:hypothetical protein [Desulfurispira natronophila]MBB5022645.1 hypothetical protein [Desulfurispira natronophila]
MPDNTKRATTWKEQREKALADPLIRREYDFLAEEFAKIEKELEQRIPSPDSQKMSKNV